MALEEDIRAHLLTTVSAASGRTFIGLMRDPSALFPHKALSVLSSGGAPANGFMDGMGTDYRRMRFQVRVRSDVGDYQGGKSLAESVWQSLQRANLTPGYVRCVTVNSEPLFWGRDDKDHYEWSVNGVAEKEE
jgi:Bacteriophage minor capsid protein